MINEEGNIYSQGKYGDLKVVKYNNSTNVECEFIKTKTLATSNIGNIRRGLIRDYMTPVVCGAGFSGSSIKMTGEARRASVCWYDMIKRCYSERFIKTRPTYINCEVSDGFKNFTTFYEWWKANHIEGMDLDKDLFSGALYSEDTCVFLPPKINNIIKPYVRNRYCGLPSGVEPHTNGRYISAIFIDGRRKYLGIFNTINDARGAHLIEKHNQIRDLAESYRHNISNKAYNGLINLCNANI